MEARTRDAPRAFVLLLSPFFFFIASCLFTIVVTTLHHGGESAMVAVAAGPFFLASGNVTGWPRLQARGAKRVSPDRQSLPETPRGRTGNLAYGMTHHAWTAA